ncbi:hypothetical protein ACFFWC_07295 [Plantactinospora siamensis]|uniref:Secreted protein n=1 Tax=Plantactinospora siamensis TaxID=555372 RepID=A0ABV6NZE1_9ACTN
MAATLLVLGLDAVLFVLFLICIRIADRNGMHPSARQCVSRLCYAVGPISQGVPQGAQSGRVPVLTSLVNAFTNSGNVKGDAGKNPERVS